METLPSAAERQQLVSFFLEIAAGQTADVASQFLEATGWNLDEAVKLFYGVSNEIGGVESAGALKEDEVRAPLPVIRDTLYGYPAAFSRSLSSSDDAPFDISRRHSAVWESSESSVVSTSNDDTHGNNLASLYTPPFALMFRGRRFDQAKVEASSHGKWLLVNLQSNEEFSSHMLNRDTWANTAVAEIIHSNFIFWQVYHDTVEGQKVCTFYNLVTLPAVLLIDPITGQKMNAWTGMVHPERFMEELLPFLDRGPKEHHAFLLQKLRQRSAANDSAAGKEAVKDDVETMVQAMAAASLEDDGEEESRPEKSSNCEKLIISYPPLLEEPQLGSKLGVCRVAIRLPDGCRLQRKFLMTDSIKLLWSFCSSKMEDGLKRRRPFHFIQFMLGVGAPSRSLKYDGSDLTFEAAGLSNSMISLVWDD